VVTITKVEYKPARSELNLEAASSEAGVAVLTVIGYGEMTYDSRKNKYSLKIRPVADPGGDGNGDLEFRRCGHRTDDLQISILSERWWNFSLGEC